MAIEVRFQWKQESLDPKKELETLPGIAANGWPTSAVDADCNTCMALSNPGIATLCLCQYHAWPPGPRKHKPRVVAATLQPIYIWGCPLVKQRCNSIVDTGFLYFPVIQHGYKKLSINRWFCLPCSDAQYTPILAIVTIVKPWMSPAFFLIETWLVFDLFLVGGWAYLSEKYDFVTWEIYFQYMESHFYSMVPVTTNQWLLTIINHH